jgi:hypothetical protein
MMNNDVLMELLNSAHAHGLLHEVLVSFASEMEVSRHTSMESAHERVGDALYSACKDWDV